MVISVSESEVEMIGLEVLKQFIIKAHANTYASLRSTPSTPYRPGATEFQHCGSDWKYTDSYYGGCKFIGEEVVSFKDEVIWGMNYWGQVIKQTENIDFKAIYSFLKKCLRVGVEDGIPFRGPNYWTTETFTYECHVEGDLTQFSGEEFIYYKNEMIYYARFHGGLVE